MGDISSFEYLINKVKNQKKEILANKIELDEASQYKALASNYHSGPVKNPYRKRDKAEKLVQVNNNERTAIMESMEVDESGETPILTAKTYTVPIDNGFRFEKEDHMGDPKYTKVNMDKLNDAHQDKSIDIVSTQVHYRDDNGEHLITMDGDGNLINMSEYVEVNGEPQMFTGNHDDIHCCTPSNILPFTISKTSDFECKEELKVLGYTMIGIFVVIFISLAIAFSKCGEIILSWFR